MWEACPSHVLSPGKLIGMLVGLAVGDALGSGLEGVPRDSVPIVMEMRGGGAFAVAPGQWTDETSMALCMATSLLERGGFEPADHLERFLGWFDHGFLSCTGVCLGIGLQNSVAINEFRQTRQVYRTYADSQRADSGSLARLAPIAIAFAHDPLVAGDIAARSSATTHAGPEAREACGTFAHLMVLAASGYSKEQMWQKASLLADGVSSPGLSDVLRGTFLRKGRDAILTTPYVVDTFEAALWAFQMTDNFHDGAILAINLGGEAGSVGAIYGQLAGAYYGVDAIPDLWLTTLHHHAMIRQVAEQLAARLGTFEVRG